MRILFIDEEETSITIFLEELKEIGHIVIHIRKIDEAFELIKNDKNFDSVILDLMMPPGKLLEDANTEGGLRTGEYFIECIKKYLPQVPITILTNVNDSDLLDNVGKMVGNRIYSKDEIDPTDHNQLMKLLS